jgi:hypothetical protein
LLGVCGRHRRDYQGALELTSLFWRLSWANGTLNRDGEGARYGFAAGGWS